MFPASIGELIQYLKEKPKVLRSNFQGQKEQVKFRRFDGSGFHWVKDNGVQIFMPLKYNGAEAQYEFRQGGFDVKLFDI